MKILKLTSLFYLILVACLHACFQDDPRFEIAKNFVADVKAGRKTDIELISQYLATDTTGSKKREGLNLLFNALRNGEPKGVDVSQLEAREYSERLAPKILVLTKEEKRNVVLVSYKSKVVYPILFNTDNKILAFSYMDKGKYKYMIVWH